MRISLAILSVLAGIATLVAVGDPLPPDASYRPLPTVPLDVVRRNDEAAKPAVMRRQQNLLNERYDLANRAMPGAMMSGGRKAVQDGVRVKLRAGTTWDSLAQMVQLEDILLLSSFAVLAGSPVLEELLRGLRHHEVEDRNERKKGDDAERDPRSQEPPVPIG